MHTSVITQAHIEKFVVSNLALKRLEFENPTECAPGLLTALIHCLSLLYQQGRGLDELVLNHVTFNSENVWEFFTVVRNLSHRFGTTLVLSPYFLLFKSSLQLLISLSKEFQGEKIKKITCHDIRRDEQPSISQLGQLTEELIVHYCT